MFKLNKTSSKSSARLASLKTRHGIISTPFFMPIATKGSVKALSSEDLGELSSQIILSNTYHLYLQPGLSVLKKQGGLHKFMNWSGPILTDSGGYQVFSLSEKTRNGKSLRTITNRGVEFKSFIDGSKHLFTPENVQKTQDIIGSDIKMVLDVCSPYPCSKAKAKTDMDITHSWAKRSLSAHKTKSLLFGIVQGSTYKDLRIESANYLSSLNFDGYGVGGLAVGESAEKMYQVLDYIVDYLPKEKPRYLMGVGKPENIIEAVKRGVDMFDCVIPSREARHGRLYMWTGKPDATKKNFYKIINISNSKFSQSKIELESGYTLGYLHHLFKAAEPLALRLATLHNIKFYLELMSSLRKQIFKNKI
jgi:queuine tRNA-ribosyltransferase